MKSFVRGRFFLGLGTFLAGVMLTLGVIWGYQYIEDRFQDKALYSDKFSVTTDVSATHSASPEPSDSRDTNDSDANDPAENNSDSNGVQDYWAAAPQKNPRSEDEEQNQGQLRPFAFPGFPDEEDVWKDFEAQTKRMEQMMQHFFGDLDSQTNTPFTFRMPQFPRPSQGFAGGSQLGFGGLAAKSPRVEIDQREDDKFVYVEIESKFIDPESVQVELNNGMISVSGKMRVENEQKGANGSARSVMISSFHQAFPVPDGVDADGMQLEQNKTKLVLKFPKLTS